MNATRLRWVHWAWKVACASYVAGALPLITGSSLIVFWTALLFTPLLAWTLAVTRSRAIAMIGIPLIGSAVLAAGYLFFAFSTNRSVPQAPAFQALFFVAVFGPFALYFIVRRHVAGLIRSAASSEPKAAA
jgi:hypothetical protein